MRALFASMILLGVCLMPLGNAAPPADRAVIWSDDFESRAPLAKRYTEYGSAKGSFIPVAGVGRHGSRGMRGRFAKGQVSAGNLKVMFGRGPVRARVRPNEDFRELFWRIYVRHQEGWVGNPAKLTRATILVNGNWSQAMIAHIWGGHKLGLGMDPASGVRGDRVVTRKYNDFERLHWLGFKEGPRQIFAPGEVGKWVCVEAHVKLNTPGRADGVFEFWLDGVLQARSANLDWVGTWRGYGLNAVFLNNYWNDGSVKAQERYFDDFVIATRRIGPGRQP